MYSIKKQFKHIWVVLAFVLLCCNLNITLEATRVTNVIHAEETVKAYSLNSKNLSVELGSTYKLKVLDYTGKVKFSSSNKKIVSVNSSTGKIVAKKLGTT